ncbi:hypothetical protein [Sphingomonas sp.]|uniref:hypothetical protein n=1 Tax=Sphingomonas sp. TaxID=28214 RepID=UPI001EBFCB58|nr:hypothetical protein [Sphingomonas sp.]MBX3593486.1 hypothetical protein [Sphingomonas sp.]
MSRPAAWWPGTGRTMCVVHPRTLAPDGIYRTASTSGTFAREADTIRLPSGPFAGAVGQLMPDEAREPAVFFERDENRRADGVHIVDPERSSATVPRKGDWG